MNPINAERVQMWAYRVLRRQSRYRSVDAMPAPDYLSGLPLTEGDELMGVYENVIGQRQGCVVFSVQGIYVDSHGGWTYIPYASMAEVIVLMPDGDKHKAEAMQIQVEGNRSQTVVFAGGDGKLREILDVWRFFARVRFPPQ